MQKKREKRRKKKVKRLVRYLSVFAHYAKIANKVLLFSFFTFHFSLVFHCFKYFRITSSILSISSGLPI